MKHDILYKPVYSLLKVYLEPEESVMAETGAMVTMSPNVEIKTAARGGLFSSLKRSMIGGESFFQNTFTSRGGPGIVTFAPPYMGDVQHIPISGDWFTQGGAYLASSQGLVIDTKFQGLKGLMSGEGLFFLKISGSGELFISSFGAIHEIELDPGQEIKVDTGNLVAFEQGITYTVERVGGLKSTFLSGEGLVTRLRGPGKVLLQTRNSSSFVSWLYPMLPIPKN
ncbi:TIGR00266 family protein [Methanocella sp. CWC-04]|uniref:TIGR00266 family protein n=1 Tax=Methanooceanicella nereidis TaxID=2052831 RepID=A0AAP2RDW9_9EURY|nr:TIGR00266 family protein [Methanocella sp. CWC-04]MCD1294860.1 TIGR00266 family protein [Methanocella sp. CWC-04]